MDLTAEGRARIGAVTGGLVPTSVTVPTGGLTLRCLVWGTATDPTALLLHGNGGHAHWWDALAPALVPGWRLVVPDLRGHGESHWAEPPRYRIEDFARDLLAVQDALAPGPIALVGHSMGGRVAAWYASEHPERVQGLAVLDSRMNRVRRNEAASWRARVAGMRAGRGYPTRDEALAAFRFVPEEGGVSPAIVANLAHHAIVERGPADWTFRFDRAVLSLDGDGAGDLLPRLGRLTCPVVVLAGAASWIVDAAQRDAMAAAIPHGALRVFPGGHHFLLAQPAAVGAALREFLDALG
ncbi:MAG TPA: alpha/beta hydrolase [Candidatus Nitrosopolaris sp.]|nr:alpha/beta hydrolase [Candidatus Nitrosopolaris sp.]